VNTDIDIKQLTELIKSLSKSEKRFYKLMASTDPDATENMIQLFNSIEKKGKINKVSSFDTNSNQPTTFELYQFILKCLRRFYSESNPNFNFKDEVLNARSLFDKAQYKQCRKLINTLKRALYETEQYNLLLKVFDIEKKILPFEDANTKTSLPIVIAREEFSAINKEIKLLKYYHLYLQVHLECETTESKAEIEEILKHPLLEDFNESLGYKEQLFILLCKTLIYKRINKTEEFKSTMQLIRLLTAKHDFLQDYYINICKFNNET